MHTIWIRSIMRIKVTILPVRFARSFLQHNNATHIHNYPAHFTTTAAIILLLDIFLIFSIKQLLTQQNNKRSTLSVQ